MKQTQNTPVEPNSEASSRPDPTREQVWDKYWGKQERVNDVYPAVSDIVAEIDASIPDVRELKILEVGTGTGREGHLLAERGAHVALLDISWEALRLSRQLSSLPSFIRGSAVRSPFRDGTFDLVYHQGLLEHFRDPSLLLRENFRLLRPGGHLLVDVPQRYHVYTCLKHGLMLINRWFAGWETEYSPQELETQVRAIGFRVVRRYGYGMHPGLPYRSLREVCKKFGVRLPMYPRFGPLQPAYKWWHDLARKVETKRWGHYLVVSVGVIAQKP